MVGGVESVTPVWGRSLIKKPLIEAEAGGQTQWCLFGAGAEPWRGLLSFLKLSLDASCISGPGLREVSEEKGGQRGQ